tara:strand:- start:1585 stop:2247 length:663 start_codon:yes stop_codon:yes gene_type:complete
MLQSYHSQIVELHEDYKQEYASDLDYFVSKASALLEGKDTEDELRSSEEGDPAGSQVCMDDVRAQGIPGGQSDPGQESRQEEISKKSDAPDWARKLFKKIALMTHPDRISDEHLRESMQKNFMRANRALEDGKMDDLLGVAIELNVDAGLDDEALIPLLKAKIESCRKSIQEIESTPEWIWGESLGMRAQRTALLAVLLNERGLQLTPEQVDELVSEKST